MMFPLGYAYASCCCLWVSGEKKQVNLTQELVALSGAHTLGSKGFGNPVIFNNAYYKVQLEKPCLSSGFWSTFAKITHHRKCSPDCSSAATMGKYDNGYTGSTCICH